VFVCVCACACACVYVYVCVCVSVCVYVNMHVCMWKYVKVYVPCRAYIDQDQRLTVREVSPVKSLKLIMTIMCMRLPHMQLSKHCVQPIDPALSTASQRFTLLQQHLSEVVWQIAWWSSNSMVSHGKLDTSWARAPITSTNLKPYTSDIHLMASVYRQKDVQVQLRSSPIICWSGNIIACRADNV